MFSSNTSQVVATATQAEAIDYDGTNDFLTRSTDFVGNANTATFTMSLWVYVDEVPASFDQLVSIGGGNLELLLTSSMGLNLDGFNGTRVLASSTGNNVIALKTWTNILISVDMSNVVLWYINDITPSSSTPTLVNTTIAVANTPHRIAGVSTQIFKGRLSNVYLDYTYRNLISSTERRKFITADLKPAAGQAAMNPIMYVAMADPTNPGLNTGTGGNFTLTGTVARSGRGPNQYNAPYSDLDGTADYLSRTSLTGIADGKAFTLHCAFSCDTPNVAQRIVSFSTNTAYRFAFFVFTSGDIQILGVNPSGVTVLDGVTAAGVVVANRNYVVDISIDLASTANRFLYVNGQSVSVTWNTYTNDNIDFAIATTPRYHIGASPTPSQYFNGRLGALWFNTSYIDLSVASNLAKFVSGTGINAAPVDLGATGQLPTGTSPLLYLPLYGNAAGLNYGTGGNFTVNSGPYTGARGPNEYWGNRADFNGTTGYLSRTSALTGVSDGKVICGSFNFTPDAAQTHQLFTIKESGGVGGLEIYVDNSGFLGFFGVLSTPTSVLNGVSSSGVIPTIGDNYSVQYCIDLSDTAKRFVYVNGVAVTMIWSTYTNSNINLDQPRVTIGARYTASGYSGFTNGKLAEFYFTTTYIDFSQEANRLKFRDAFGNPVNLTQQIEALAIPNPAIYMRFPPTSFGTNSGTGGNFTVDGTITDGGQL